MAAPKTVSYSSEERTRMEIRGFINEGLQDVRNQCLHHLDEAFDEIESRYNNDRL